MNREQLLNEIRNHMYWENMFAHVWRDGEDEYTVEFKKNIINLDEKNYIGCVNLSEWYWNSTDDFEPATKDKAVIDYVNDCIAEELGI